MTSVKSLKLRVRKVGLLARSIFRLQCGLFIIAWMAQMGHAVGNLKLGPSTGSEAFFLLFMLALGSGVLCGSYYAFRLASESRVEYGTLRYGVGCRHLVHLNTVVLRRVSVDASGQVFQLLLKTTSGARYVVLTCADYDRLLAVIDKQLLPSAVLETEHVPMIHFYINSVSVVTMILFIYRQWVTF